MKKPSTTATNMERSFSPWRCRAQPLPSMSILGAQGVHLGVLGWWFTSQHWWRDHVMLVFKHSPLACKADTPAQCTVWGKGITVPKYNPADISRMEPFLFK